MSLFFQPCKHHTKLLQTTVSRFYIEKKKKCFDWRFKTKVWYFGHDKPSIELFNDVPPCLLSFLLLLLASYWWADKF